MIYAIKAAAAVTAAAILISGLLLGGAFLAGLGIGIIAKFFCYGFHLTF